MDRPDHESAPPGTAKEATVTAEMLRDQHAIVTGGSRGIGAAIATALSAAGARVTIVGRDLRALREVAASAPGEAAAEVADVADAAAVSAAFARARKRFGAVRVLVNNAGQVETAPVSRITLELWENLLRVNLTGTFVCCQNVLPDMRAAGAGRIVNMASTAALRGYPYVAAYAAAKHGVVGFTRSLALEVAAQGITVNALCPGYADTDIVRRGVEKIMAATGRAESEARSVFTGHNPQRRLIEVDEVAAAVLWLCGAGARGVNGAAIPISGGEV